MRKSYSEFYQLQMLNDSLHPVANIILLSNFKTATVTIVDESLWPSQKAIILGTGVLMIWELVKPQPPKTNNSTRTINFLL